MANFLIYDCEIINCIPGRDGEKNPEFSYCAGWNDHANMGISVIGLYSSLWDSTAHLVDKDFHRMEPIAAQHDWIVGFNSRNFDDRLLAANGISIKTTYDLLEEARIAAGWGATYDTVPRGYSYSLQALAIANGDSKSGSGELAPMLWQMGKHQEVIDYCLQDIHVTRKILELGLAGELLDPNTGEKLRLRGMA